MRFSNSFLDEIRDRVSISDVIGRRVSWDKKKTNTSRGDYWACCPFHGEKSPSFHCEDRKGRYHCFGCGVSGDHFRFLTELEGLSFPEAVQQIADMAGISMPQPDPQAEKRERERTSLQDVMEMATLFFQDQLQTKFQELHRLNLLRARYTQIMGRFVGCSILDQYTQDLHLIHIRLQAQRQVKLQVLAHLVRLYRGGKPQYLFQMEFLHVKFVKSTAKLGSIC